MLFNVIIHFLRPKLLSIKYTCSFQENSSTSIRNIQSTEKSWILVHETSQMQNRKLECISRKHTVCTFPNFPVILGVYVLRSVRPAKKSSCSKWMNLFKWASQFFLNIKYRSRFIWICLLCSGQMMGFHMCISGVYLI